MQVRGRHIYSAAGERVILRGVNEMFSISKDPTGSWVMGEIAKTGANAVRIFPNGDCRKENRYDMTKGGVFGRWKTEAGRNIAVAHPASIRNTSRRPCSIPNAGTNCVPPGSHPHHRRKSRGRTS